MTLEPKDIIEALECLGSDDSRPLTHEETQLFEALMRSLLWSKTTPEIVHCFKLRPFGLPNQQTKCFVLAVDEHYTLLLRPCQ